MGLKSKHRVCDRKGVGGANDVRCSAPLFISHSEKGLGVSHVFLYGAEIEDVKSLNYNTLYTLNISATQELYRIVQELTETVKSQAKEIKKLQNTSVVYCESLL